jgi:Spy/CpxP family protein refolding chaperone
VKRFALWFVLVASLSANVAVGAVAVRRHGSGPSDEPLLFSKVALDAGQRARISELRKQLVASRDEHARRMSELRTQLAATMLHDPENHAHVDAVLRDIAASQASFQHAVVDHVIAVRGVLHADQRPAFEEIVAGHMRSGGPMQCGLGPGPDGH